MDKKRKLIFIVFLVVAFIGFVDASYLTANHFMNIAPPCFIAQGCDVVTTSAYSKILGIPVALLGALFYLSIFMLTVFILEKGKLNLVSLLPWICGVGFLASIWFVFAQIVIIKSICTYCILSAGTSTTLFILSFFIRKNTLSNTANI